ncbi:MAG: hypothetical protein D6730_15580 [Bacteroidetes bacterium]|nr:MAG: hypothetical protein D6730_15580 [Bacteroidota bacterium]
MRDMRQPGKHKEEQRYETATLRAYVRGELPETMQREIEAYMKTNETCATIVQGLRYLEEQAAAGGATAEAFLAQSATQQQKLIQQYVAKKNKVKRRSWLAAAAVLLLAALGIAFSLSGRKQVPPEALLAQALSQPYVFPEQTRGTQLPPASEAYAQGRYAQVIRLLEQAPALSEKEEFMLGLAYLYQQQYSRALPPLRAVLARNQIRNGYAEQARWFLVLALFQLKRNAEACELLQPILANPQHYQHAPAQGLKALC